MPRARRVARVNGRDRAPRQMRRRCPATWLGLGLLERISRKGRPRVGTSPPRVSSLTGPATEGRGPTRFQISISWHKHSFFTVHKRRLDVFISHSNSQKMFSSQLINKYDFYFVLRDSNILDVFVSRTMVKWNGTVPFQRHGTVPFQRHGHINVRFRQNEEWNGSVFCSHKIIEKSL
jgi:hypothetical protein